MGGGGEGQGQARFRGSVVSPGLGLSWGVTSGGARQADGAPTPTTLLTLAIGGVGRVWGFRCLCNPVGRPALCHPATHIRSCSGPGGGCPGCFPARGPPCVPGTERRVGGRTLPQTGVWRGHRGPGPCCAPLSPLRAAEACSLALGRAPISRQCTTLAAWDHQRGTRVSCSPCTEVGTRPALTGGRAKV